MFLQLSLVRNAETDNSQTERKTMKIYKQTPGYNLIFSSKIFTTSADHNFQSSKMPRIELTYENNWGLQRPDESAPNFVTNDKTMRRLTLLQNRMKRTIEMPSNQGCNEIVNKGIPNNCKPTHVSKKMTTSSFNVKCNVECIERLGEGYTETCHIVGNQKGCPITGQVNRKKKTKPKNAYIRTHEYKKHRLKTDRGIRTI